MTSPKNIEYTVRYLSGGSADYDFNSSADFVDSDSVCWIAFRTGSFPPMTEYADRSDIYLEYFGASTMVIEYSEPNCTQYKNTTTFSQLRLDQETVYSEEYNWFETGNCSSNRNVGCTTLGYDEIPKCRISVRMSALLTLTICLVIKAIYMVAVNVASRHSTKSQCLTFGDVIVAASMDRDSRIYNECMVNAGDGYRHKIAHTCHKHCKEAEPSATGDSIGHCQICNKHNIMDKAANLVHPTIAIKYKKSLLSNLGSTALVQMIILMFCSLAMLGVSVFLAYGFGSSAASFEGECLNTESGDFGWPCTNAGRAQYLKAHFGTFGGFNSSADLTGASALDNEAAAFFIANGAQVLYSALYLLLTYNLTLISMELDWGRFEMTRQRLRCTLVRGSGFSQSYLLQLPKKVLYPMMTFSATMHWLLGQAISARETVYADLGNQQHGSETSVYSVLRPYSTYSG